MDFIFETVSYIYQLYFNHWKRRGAAILLVAIVFGLAIRSNVAHASWITKIILIFAFAALDLALVGTLSILAERIKVRPPQL